MIMDDNKTLMEEAMLLKQMQWQLEGIVALKQG